MTEETNIEQTQSAVDKAREYWNGFPEAPYSDSFKWVDTNGFEHLSTVRAWTGGTLLSGIERITTAIFERGGVPAGQYRATVPSGNNSPEPVRTPIDDNGNALPDVKSAVAGRLSWEVHDGKTSYKVLDAVFPAGEKGTKYGITVWPEVLKAAGLTMEQGQPVPNISGWRVDYICNDKGYPAKVIRLLPPTK